MSRSNLIKAVNKLSEDFMKEIPDGWEKHNALCNLQQSIWWALKGMDQTTPMADEEND